MLDTQQIELLGRNRLVNEIIRANLEVTVPIRDRGIDMIAYADRGWERKTLLDGAGVWPNKTGIDIKLIV